MEILDSSIRRFLSFHFDERKSARTPRITICHNADGFHRSDLGKDFFQILLGHAEGQVTNVQTNWHKFSS
jgi:hypothetical protein